jgi:tetratricopeptide (TPR) repeat protein
MQNHRYLALVALIVLIVLSACSSNKQIQVASEPVRNPLALALEAASDGAEFYEDGMLEMAIEAFGNAVVLFTEAAPTAAESDSVYQNIESMQLNIAKSHVDLAFENIEMSMYGNAVEHYETALAIYKHHVPVRITQAELDDYVKGTLNNLAIASRNAGNFEATLGYYDQLLEMEPNNAELLNQKFFILKDDLNDSARAFQVLEDYATVAKDASAFIMLAEGYAQSGDYVKAEAAYKKAEALRPDADMFTRISNFYRANSKWAESNTYLEKLAATNPSQDLLAIAFTQIGQNYDQLKNNAKKIEYFEKSVDVKPDSRLALVLAAHYNGAKNWNRVINFSTIVLSEEPNNSDARMLRGVAYFQQKNNAAAKADLERIVNDPRHGAQAQNILKNIK